MDRHGANSGTKKLTVMGAMPAGGDSIDDTALLHVGASEAVFGATRAPSTVGSWLRAFRWHNVRQLDAVPRETLRRLWEAGAGRPIAPRPSPGSGTTRPRPPRRSPRTSGHRATTRAVDRAK